MGTAQLASKKRTHFSTNKIFKKVHFFEIYSTQASFNTNKVFQKDVVRCSSKLKSTACHYLLARTRGAIVSGSVRLSVRQQFCTLLFLARNQIKTWTVKEYLLLVCIWVNVLSSDDKCASRIWSKIKIIFKIIELSCSALDWFK